MGWQWGQEHHHEEEVLPPGGVASSIGSPGGQQQRRDGAGCSGAPQPAVQPRLKAGQRRNSTGGRPAAPSHGKEGIRQIPAPDWERDPQGSGIGAEQREQRGRRARPAVRYPPGGGAGVGWQWDRERHCKEEVLPSGRVASPISSPGSRQLRQDGAGCSGAPHRQYSLATRRGNTATARVAVPPCSTAARRESARSTHQIGSVTRRDAELVPSDESSADVPLVLLFSTPPEEGQEWDGSGAGSVTAMRRSCRLAALPP